MAKPTHEHLDQVNEHADEQRIVLFESADGEVSLSVNVDEETVWLTQAQMAELFATTKQNVSLHVNNCFREGELEPEAVVKDSLTTAADGKRYRVRLYNLDVIISVGYRVKSSRGVEFRRWATDVLRRYVVAGHAENERRLEQLGQVAKIMARVPRAWSPARSSTSSRATPGRSTFWTTTTTSA